MALTGYIQDKLVVQVKELLHQDSTALEVQELEQVALKGCIQDKQELEEVQEVYRQASTWLEVQELG